MLTKGIVKWFNAGKGYGFIAKEGTKDIYVNQSAIQNSDSGGLRQGQKVQFEVVSGPKGTQAANVTVIEAAKQSVESQIRAFKKESKDIQRDLKKRRDSR